MFLIFDIKKFIELTSKMLSYLMNEMTFNKKRDYECTALTNWATGPEN